MASNLKSYHPSAILKEKRAKQLELAKAEALKADAAARDASAVVAELNGANGTSAGPAPVKVKKEGLAGILQDTMDYLDAGIEVIAQLDAKYNQMMATLAQTLDLKIDDQDRKKINKDFMVQKKEFDDLAKNSLVFGDPLFSGKFAQKGKSLKIGMTDEESIVIRQAALHLEGLGISRVRVDSLVNARKAQPLLDKVKLELAEARKSLKARTETVSFKQAKVENKEKQADEAEQNKMKFASFNTDLEYYRIMQKKAAEAKGRDYALLINLKI